MIRITLLMVGCRAAGVQSGASSGALVLTDVQGVERYIELDGGALSFDCGRCDDALYVVLTDQPRNFDCTWAHANYGTEAGRAPDRGGAHWNLFWDARLPDTLQVVRARPGLRALADEAETYTVAVEMVWEEEGTRGELRLEDQSPLRFEAEHCGRVE